MAIRRVFTRRPIARSAIQSARTRINRRGALRRRVGLSVRRGLQLRTRPSSYNWVGPNPGRLGGSLWNRTYMRR